MQQEVNYDGIESVTVSADKLPFLELGNYPKLEILKISDGVTQGPTGGDQYFRIEVKVRESEGPTANPVGTDAVVIIKKSPKDKFGYFLKDVKKFVAALLDEPVTNVSPNAVKGLTKPTNPAKGNLIAAQVTMPEGKTFPKIRWISIPGVSGNKTGKKN